MDVLSNAEKYGIWESEDPEITLKWKKFNDERGFKTFRWSLDHVKAFLDTLGRLSGGTPSSFYEENKINPGDEDLGIDASEKAARIYADLITKTNWTNAASSLFAKQIQEQINGLLEYAKNLIPLAKEAREEFRNIETKDLIAAVLSQGGDVSNTYPAVLELLKKKAPKAAVFFAREGNYPFRLLLDNWFIFKQSRDVSVLSSIPAPLEVILSAFAGHCISFDFENRSFLFAYPFNPTSLNQDAYLYILKNNEYEIKAKGSFDRLLTTGKIYGESSSPMLLKVIRNARNQKALRPEEVEELLKSHQ